MERYVLFSPIGGTDPISMDRDASTVNDGSMLHIVRKYHPEYVVLYLSAEMLGHQKEDKRYTDCIERLARKDGFLCEYVTVDRPDLWEAQRYDIYLKDFREQVNQLHEQFPKHTVLLNCSSGTPGMKNALYLLGCILPYPVLPIQVSTPVKRENSKYDKRDYNTDIFWEWNLDNAPSGCIYRTRELEYTNLNAQLAFRSIKAHIKAFDYEAAYRTGDEVREYLNGETMELLDAARNRILLNWKSIPAAIQRRFGLHPETDSEERIQLSEYLLWLQMKQKRGDLGDFVRGLTPALFALLRIAVEENGDTPISAYCTDGDRITRDSLDRDERGHSFLAFFPQDFQRGFLQTSNYDAAIEKLFNDRPWASPLQDLRSIEGSMRNFVAHTITRVDENGLKNLQKGPARYRKSSGEIMELIRKSVEGINSDERNASGKTIRINWDSYEMMNQKIMESIDRSAPTE